MGTFTPPPSFVRWAGFIPDTTIPDLTKHRTGYGMSLSGAWQLGRLRDTIVFQGIGGRGIANYYNDNYG
jgi:hypothetical protein